MTLLKRHLGLWLAAAALAGAASAAAQAPTPSATAAATPAQPAAAVPAIDEARSKAWGRPVRLPPPPPPGTEADFAQERKLKERAQRYWDALRDGKHGDAWDFISPAGRLTITREAYAVRMATIPLTAATVTETLCRNGECTSTALVEYDAVVPRVGKIRQSSLTTDVWRVQDDQLWLILR